MADKSNQSKDESRPFLASDDQAHQARLMNNTHKAGKSEIDDSPAPILPPIVSHPGVSEADEPPKTAQQQSSGHDQTTALPSHNIELEQSASESAASTEASNDSDDIASSPSLYPSSQKAVASLIVAVVALVGFSAAWYNLNKDIYTLGDQQPTAVAENPTPSQSNPATLGAEDGQPTLSLSVANLPALGQGHYQLWVKHADKTQSLGIFTIKDGQAVNQDDQKFQPALGQGIDQATLFVSIEPGDAEATSPSATIILTGELKDKQAELSFQAIDLSQASGSFTIAAPSDLSGDHQHSGIWFAKTDGQQLTEPSLSIPHAPAGWKYEGQVVYKDTAVAMGRFSRPDQTDDFYGFTPNPDHIPTNFPGEDYLAGQPDSLGVDFPANLTTGEWEVVISVEPDIDGQDPTGDKTFFLQPLSAAIAKDSENYKEYPLKRDLSKFPTATITFE